MSEAAAPATTAAPAPTAPTTASPAPTSPTTGGDWVSSLSEESRGYVQNKGFKDPGSVIDSYRNLEKLMGAPKERLLKLPEKDDDAAGWSEVFDRLGRPKSAKEYDIKTPEGMGDGKFAEWAKQNFYELGLSKKTAEKLAGKWNEFAVNNHKQSNEAITAKLEQEGVGLKTEWGAAYQQNIDTAKKAANTFKVKGDMIDKIESAIGFAETMKFFHNIGSKLGEDTFVTGGATNFEGALSPEAARNRITTLRGDSEFVKKYVAGDAKAKEEFERLHRYGYPDAV